MEQQLAVGGLVTFLGTPVITDMTIASIRRIRSKSLGHGLETPGYRRIKAVKASQYVEASEQYFMLA